MPKVTIGGSDFADIEAAEGFANYDGPVPPSGVYLCKTKLWNLVTNKSGDLMFKIIFEIAEPRGTEKHRYNGYAIWHNANLTNKSAPYTNAMLDALGIPRKAVWGETGRVIVDPEDDKGERVLKIGGKSPLGLLVKVQGKRSEYPVGSHEFKLESKSFFPYEDDADVDDDDAFSAMDDTNLDDEKDLPASKRAVSVDDEDDAPKSGAANSVADDDDSDEF